MGLEVAMAMAAGVEATACGKGMMRNSTEGTQRGEAGQRIRSFSTLQSDILADHHHLLSMSIKPALLSHLSGLIYRMKTRLRRRMARIMPSHFLANQGSSQQALISDKRLAITTGETDGMIKGAQASTLNRSRKVTARESATETDAVAEARGRECPDTDKGSGERRIALIDRGTWTETEVAAGIETGMAMVNLARGAFRTQARVSCLLHLLIIISIIIILVPPDMGRLRRICLTISRLYIADFRHPRLLAMQYILDSAHTQT